MTNIELVQNLCDGKCDVVVTWLQSEGIQTREAAKNKIIGMHGEVMVNWLLNVVGYPNPTGIADEVEKVLNAFVN